MELGVIGDNILVPDDGLILGLSLSFGNDIDQWAVLGFIGGTFDGVVLGTTDVIKIGATEGISFVPGDWVVLALIICLIDGMENGTDDGDTLGTQ